MAWKDRRVYRKQKELEMQENVRNSAKIEALKEIGVNYSSKDTEEKKVSEMQRIHEENEKKREESQEEKKKIEKRKEEKLKEREAWKEKFKKRTRKGQIPLDIRMNYLYKKIKR